MIDLKNSKHNFLLINTLNGGAHLITEDQKFIIDKWILNKIVPLNQGEENFLNQLIEGGYIFESYAVEIMRREHMMKNLRLAYEKEKLYTNYVTLLLTYDCNFACPYCYESANKHMSKIMTKEMVDAVFEIHNNNIEYITLFGGEPLLMKNQSIIKYIISKSPQSKLTIITNGYNLLKYRDIFQEVKQNLEFHITLDGDEVHHNKSRILKTGASTFNQIMEGIDFYIKNGNLIKFRMNISYENYNNCIKLRKTLLATYKDYLDLISFEMQPLFKYENKEYSELLSMIVEADYDNDIKEAGKENRIITSTTPLVYSFLCNVGSKPKYTNCPAQTYNRVYDSEGNIYGCLVSVGEPRKALGTYYPKYEFFKDKTYLHRNIETVEKCRKCVNAFYCGGGCPDAAVEIFGDCMEPECGRFLSMTYELIPKILEHINF